MREPLLYAVRSQQEETDLRARGCLLYCRGRSGNEQLYVWLDRRVPLNTNGENRSVPVGLDIQGLQPIWIRLRL